MIDESTLLNAIRANPDDDTVRLVYADWLQEHGEEIRADFIRKHIESERNRCKRCEIHAGKLLGVDRPIDFLVDVTQFVTLVTTSSFFLRADGHRREMISVSDMVRRDFPNCPKCEHCGYVIPYSG